MKRFLMMLLLALATMGANAQWKVGIITKNMNPTLKFGDGYIGERLGYVKNRNGSYTIFESIDYEYQQINRVGTCSEQFFKSHVKLTDYYYGEITDPKDNYVNIRKGPGTQYPIVHKADVGTPFLFKKTGSNWYEVYAGKNFYYALDVYGGGALYSNFHGEESELDKLIKVGYIYRDRVKSPDFFDKESLR